ncbi:MAG: DNA-binding transcriptional regulator [Burkholderiales bacterium]|nr:DNA-binding transcriptional regulator [Burkholderiales bacterium]
MTRATTPPAVQYKEVRGLIRGLAVLRAMNRMAGGIGGVIEIARATGIHRTTVKRLLETLKSEGLVVHKDDGSAYALTYEVRRLSDGYIGTDWIDRIAAPAMFAHLKNLSWPSDLATPDGGFMLVRESTHRESLLSQHRSTIGVRIPMLLSSLGRAWLAHCSDEEREATLAVLRARSDAIGETARNTRSINRMLAETRRRGYGMNHGELPDEASVTAIAFPIFDGQRALGAINLVMIREVVQPREIRSRYVPLLRALTEQISQQVSARRKKG